MRDIERKKGQNMKEKMEKNGTPIQQDQNGKKTKEKKKQTIK